MLLVSAGLLIGAAVLGVGALSELQTNGAFQDPSADSTAAQRLLDEQFDGAANVVLLAHAREGTFDDAAVAAAGAAATRRLSSEPCVADVVSYWDTHDPALRSSDGRYGPVIGSERTSHQLDAGALGDLASTSRAATVTVGGGSGVDNNVKTQVGKSLAIAEAIAVPIILVLLVFAFGSVVAAMLPLAIGAVAITGTFAELFLLGSVTNVAVYAINLATALGLSLAIDCALLMVNRYREELTGPEDLAQAVARAVVTAGRHAAQRSIRSRGRVARW